MPVMMFPFFLLNPDWYLLASRARRSRRREPQRDVHGWYHLELQHRGEDMLYVDEHGAIFVFVHLAKPFGVHLPSNLRWSSGRRLRTAERAIVLERFQRYFSSIGVDDAACR